jgi:hypothetical protein
MINNEVNIDILLNDIDLPISKIILNYPIDIKNNIYNYLKSMSTIEQISYSVAYKYLGESFDVIKSIGYNDFINESNGL